MPFFRWPSQARRTVTTRSSSGTSTSFAPAVAAGGGLDWVTNALDSIPARKCVDAEPNYERFPQSVLRPPPPLSAADDCFALRFSLMSESAASAIERPERV